jgi:hypothetical protein
MFGRILDRHRKPVGYIDANALKNAWEAGDIDAVCLSTFI